MLKEATVSELRHPVLIHRDVLIPMRDGVHLAANLYLPEGAGPVPAILQYTPYLKDGRGGRGPVDTAQRYFAERGYACLSLDLRGFGCSEGIPAPLFSESEKLDGHDALEWIAAQPWCDGRTAMWGLSYGGDTCLSVASAQPPSLKAIVPIHAIDDEFSGVCYPHGCRGGLWAEVDWGVRMIGLQLLPPLRFDADRRWARLWRERLDRFEPAPLAWHTISPATWASWRADVGSIRAATYAVSAWHDCYPRETLAYYNAIPAPKRALIGPWKHEYPDRAANHRIGFWREMMRWWDRWLRDVDTGIMDKPPIVVFDQNGDGWRYENQWPPGRAAMRDYYLQPEGRLGRQPPTDDGADNYRVDPTVGLAHLPWDWTTATRSEPADISPDDHRALTYTTEALEGDLQISGNLEFVIHLSADQPDFPLAAWLSDVAPNGFSTLICQGWIRPSYAAGEPLRPDRVYEFRIPLHPTSYRLPAGHRLRLAVAGANFPALVSAPINPRLTVHRSPQRPSKLLLPVAPASSPSERRPTFSEPVAENPEAYLIHNGDYTITRDLSDRTAEYTAGHRGLYRLEADTLLRSNLQLQVTINTHSPGDVIMRGAETLAVERGGAGDIVVTTEVLETFDHYHVAAEVTLDGRSFFQRACDLDLSAAEWSVKNSSQFTPSPRPQTQRRI